MYDMWEVFLCVERGDGCEQQEMAIQAGEVKKCLKFIEELLNSL